MCVCVRVAFICLLALLVSGGTRVVNLLCACWLFSCGRIPWCVFFAYLLRHCFLVFAFWGCCREVLCNSTFWLHMRLAAARLCLALVCGLADHARRPFKSSYWCVLVRSCLRSTRVCFIDSCSRRAFSFPAGGLLFESLGLTTCSLHKARSCMAAIDLRAQCVICCGLHERAAPEA